MVRYVASGGHPMGLLRKIGGAFVDMSDEPQPADGAALDPIGDDVVAPREDGSVSPVTAGDGSVAGLDTILAADFPDIYAQAGVVGDPNADALLVAYGRGMEAVPEEPRRVAVSGMAMAMHADVKAVIALLNARADALRAAVSGVKERITDIQSRRSADLVDERACTEERIQQLQGQIADLQRKLDQTVTAVAQQDAGEDAAVRILDSRLKTEVDRLGKVLEFFNSLATPAKK